MKCKSIIGLFMAVVMLLAFSVPSFAAEANDSDFDPEVHFTPADEDAMPRMPGLAGIYSVSATSKNSATGQSGSTTTAYGNGRTSYVHVTLDDYGRQRYDAIKADSYFVDIDFNLTGATRYELFLNGELVDSGRVAVSRGYLSFTIKDERPAIWRVNLYDNTATGKSTWGHINYK